MVQGWVESSRGALQSLRRIVVVTYLSFREPHPDYVCLSLHGKAALKSLNKGGRQKKLKEATLIIRASFLTMYHPTKRLAKDHSSARLVPVAKVHTLNYELQSGHHMRLITTSQHAKSLWIPDWASSSMPFDSFWNESERSVPFVLGHL